MKLLSHAALLLAGIYIAQNYEVPDVKELALKTLEALKSMEKPKN